MAHPYYFIAIINTVPAFGLPRLDRADALEDALVVEGTRLVVPRPYPLERPAPACWVRRARGLARSGSVGDEDGAGVVCHARLAVIEFRTAGELAPAYHSIRTQ
jgi:hypothetical protein